MEYVSCFSGRTSGQFDFCRINYAQLVALPTVGDLAHGMHTIYLNHFARIPFFLLLKLFSRQISIMLEQNLKQLLQAEQIVEHVSLLLNGKSITSSNIISQYNVPRIAFKFRGNVLGTVKDSKVKYDLLTYGASLLTLLTLRLSRFSYHCT